MEGRQTILIGKKTIELESVGSTNTFLQTISLQQDLPEGAAVTASYQDQGRGQRGTSWQSEKGKNLLLSVFLKPYQTCGIKASDVFILSQAVALAVRDLVAHYITGFELQIKWPNDILVDKKKISGILIENSIQGMDVQASVVGIGLNVNQVNDLPETATSLRMLTGKEYDLRMVQEDLFAFLEKRYLFLKGGNYELVAKQYLHYLYGYEKPVFFCRDGKEEILTGVIQGVERDGKLWMESPPWTGQKEKFDLKEIRFV